MQQGVRIAPSILSADFAALGEEIRAVEAAGAVKALPKHTALTFVHPMISPDAANIARLRAA